MTLADFVITVHAEPERQVRVVVYDSVKGLRSAATRWDNLGARKGRRKRGEFAETLGICHRFRRGTYDSDGELVPNPLVAIVRLAEPHLGVGIVSHEMAHAAVWINELDAEGDPAPIVCDNDEPFVWLVGELVRQAINGMSAAGVYERTGQDE